MNVIHFGDLHVWRKEIVWSELYFPKRILGPINLHLKRSKKFPPEYREPVIQSILEADADLVIFSGDFTTGALESEYQEAARLFQPLLDHYGDRLFAIPGNHDRYTPGSEKAKLLDRYLPFASTDRIKTLNISDSLTLIGVDHSKPFAIRSNGYVNDETHEALRTALSRVRQEERIPVVVGHFPCESPPEHPESWEHGLIGEERVRDLLTEFEVPLYLHGHKHVRWAKRFDTLPTTQCLNCGSAGMMSTSDEKQAGYLQFDLSPEGTAGQVTPYLLNPDKKRCKAHVPS